MTSILTLAASVPLYATPFEGEYLHWLTSSIFVAVLVTVTVLLWARASVKNMQLIPGPTQNLFEALIEGLYNMLEGVVGRHMIGKTFGFLATIFIYILFSNWFGLLPGVGSIGWGHYDGPLGNIPHVEAPILRPATADLNLTLGLAALAMILWAYWTLRETGLPKFLKHTFAPNTGMTGLAATALGVVFFFVGLLELISIATRPVSLSLRLFGNIFAGENILAMMMTIGHEFHLPEAVSFVVGIIVTLPFYLLEVGVGALQAFVFMLLVAVYIQLSTTHDEAH